MNATDACTVFSTPKYYEDRLKTFDSWPKQMMPNKYDLAKCGFTYTGTGDNVKCFHCGIHLKDWERTDNPWNEHYKWSPACNYLKMIGWNEGVNVPDTHAGFGQVKTSTPSDRLGGDRFHLPKTQTSVPMDIDDRPAVQTTAGFKWGSIPKTDSNVFVYRY
ncbi:MAG: baculoviral IAP repeat-containing protein [Sedimenticola sp.]